MKTIERRGCAVGSSFFVSPQLWILTSMNNIVYSISIAIVYSVGSMGRKRGASLKKPGIAEIEGALYEVVLETGSDRLPIDAMSFGELLKRVNEKLVDAGYEPLTEPRQVELLKKVVRENTRYDYLLGKQVIAVRNLLIPRTTLYRDIPDEAIERAVEEAFCRYLNEELFKRFPHLRNRPLPALVVSLQDLYPYIANELRKHGYPVPSLPTLFAWLKNIEDKYIAKGEHYIHVGIPDYRGKEIPIPVQFYHLRHVKANILEA